MSSDGITRKSTKGWEISPSGGMSLGNNKVMVIEEPTVPAMAAMTEAARAEAAKAAAANAQAAPPDAGKTEVDAAPPEQPRPRRTTLDLFNDEMAVMERPIEGDVEYIDEKPPSRWRPVAAFIGAVAFVGVGGALLISHHRSAVAARAAPEPSATAPVVAAAVPAAAVAAAPAPAPAAAAAPAPADDAEADDQPAADGSAWKAPSRTEWTKTRTKVTASKHARAGGGGKTVYRRTTTTTVRHRHVVKRTVSGRR